MDNTFPPSGSPPPPTPPPVIMPSPQKPRKSRGWMIFAIILIVLLGFSLLGNFTQFVSHAFSLGNGLNSNFKTMSARQVGPKLDEVLIEDNDARSKIAVIPVEGVISSSSIDQSGNTIVDIIKAQLDRASDDRAVKAVILKVNSPGGEVMPSDDINKLIAQFQSDSHKPVICSMGSLAASGGYYISAPCRWIEANPLTLTASIGVIMEGINYRGLMDKVGIRPEVYKSGKHKDMLSGMRETNEIPADEKQMMQDLIMETYGQFTNVVLQGRTAAHTANGDKGKALAQDWLDYADGRVVSGKEALRLGFVDGLGDFNDAVAKAKEIAKIREANIVEYRERYDISDLFSMFGQSSKTHDIKLDMGIEAPKLQAGERYFLWLPPGE